MNFAQNLCLDLPLVHLYQRFAWIGLSTRNDERDSGQYKTQLQCIHIGLPCCCWGVQFNILIRTAPATVQHETFHAGHGV